MISLKEERVRAQCRVECSLRCMVCSLIPLWADGGILPAKCRKEFRVWNEGCGGDAGRWELDVSGMLGERSTLPGRQMRGVVDPRLINQYRDVLVGGKNRSPKRAG